MCYLLLLNLTGLLYNWFLNASVSKIRFLMERSKIYEISTYLQSEVKSQYEKPHSSGRVRLTSLGCPPNVGSSFILNIRPLHCPTLLYIECVNTNYMPLSWFQMMATR